MSEQETPLTFHPFAIDLYLKELVSKVVDEADKEKEEKRKEWMRESNATGV